jgi:hypothetical protein
VVSFLLINSHRAIWAILHEQTLPALLLSMPFFGAMLLWGMLAVLAFREKAVTPTSQLTTHKSPQDKAAQLASSK